MIEKAITDKLILSGHTKNYIRRALKVYERNYGTNYNTEVIAEIIRRLRKKDAYKKKQHHPKSRSETFDVSRSFSPRKKSKSKRSLQRKKSKPLNLAKSHKSNRSYHSQHYYGMGINDSYDDEDEQSDSNNQHSFRPPPIRTQQPQQQQQQNQQQQQQQFDQMDVGNTGQSPFEMERNWKIGDIVQYAQYKAEIINIADNSAAIEISYPLNGYSEYHRKKAWVGISDIKFTV